MTEDKNLSYLDMSSELYFQKIYGTAGILPFFMSSSDDIEMKIEEKDVC